MASLSAKFLLVTVLVHLSIILLAVHAEEEEEELTTNPESLPPVLLLQYDAEEELEARGAKKFFRKVFRCKKITKFNRKICAKLQKGKPAEAPPAEAPPAEAPPAEAPPAEAPAEEAPAK
ncbi:hypothetical protein NFI96_027936 [Prochilodus magdalenae]|nr:hypothetical protein NFI96_027936 [Prochilodus magdalenae]